MGPDHIVFLPEDKFTHGRQARRADVTLPPTHLTLGVVVSLKAKLETVLVWMTQSAHGKGVEFHRKSATNQRQHNKR